MVPRTALHLDDRSRHADLPGPDAGTAEGRLVQDLGRPGHVPDVRRVGWAAPAASSRQDQSANRAHRERLHEAADAALAMCPELQLNAVGYEREVKPELFRAFPMSSSRRPAAGDVKWSVPNAISDDKPKVDFRRRSRLTPAFRAFGPGAQIASPA